MIHEYFDDADSGEEGSGGDDSVDLEGADAETDH